MNLLAGNKKLIDLVLDWHQVEYAGTNHKVCVSGIVTLQIKL